MDTEEKRIKHLEIIQGVINRMACHSFLLKGWSVVLVSALFALAAKDANKFYVYLAYFPSIAFWGLDGYFLWQERLYRKLYDKVRSMDNAKIDFSMNTSYDWVNDNGYKNMGDWIEAAAKKAGK